MAREWGYHLRKSTRALNGWHPANYTQAPTSTTPAITVVCISDTHNNQPILPPGDILIHAGDLTERGTFEELQAQLDWLNAQPHSHKIVIAGNHDVLLDEAFMRRHPARRYGSTKTAADLDFGTLTYLNDTSTSIEVILAGGTTRTLSIFGSPCTPEFLGSAFQYPFRAAARWTKLIPKGTDIVVVHGPPRLHLDTVGTQPHPVSTALDLDLDGPHHAGCDCLADTVALVRPRLVVFGHIHGCRGREDVLLHSAKRIHDQILDNQHDDLGLLACVVAWAWVQRAFGKKQWGRKTTYVNAAVVGDKNELKHEAMVVEI
jgi:3',5'-cyclic AMP phosphodiesterase CpdA